MTDKAFARGANRQRIDSCVDVGLGRVEFIEIALNYMKEIAPQIGL